MEDVNYLLHRQQISSMRAERAAGPESRAAHNDLARRYRAQVDAYREANRSEMGCSAG